MKISNSKRQLAKLLIEAGVTQFPKDANWAAQDKDDGRVWFHNCKDRPHKFFRRGYWDGRRVNSVQLPTLIPNWHQDVLSRDEFDQIVAETSEPPMTKDERCIQEAFVPKPTTTSPTIDQLLQDWCNADDYAQRKQTEADEAAAMRDERWQAVQVRAGEMGVTVGRCESVATKPKLVITNWQDLQVGDEIEVVKSKKPAREGMVGVVNSFDKTDDLQPVRVIFGGNVRCYDWPTEWRFIRRPAK